MPKWFTKFINLFKEKEIISPTQREIEIYNYLQDILDYKYIPVSSISDRIKTRDIIHEKLCMITRNNKSTDVFTIPYNTLINLVKLANENRFSHTYKIKESDYGD